MLFEKQNACPLCLFFSYQRDDEDGGDMDSYQVSLLLSFCGMGHKLLLMASTRKAEGREEEAGPSSKNVQSFPRFGFALNIIRDPVLWPDFSVRSKCVIRLPRCCAVSNRLVKTWEARPLSLYSVNDF